MIPVSQAFSTGEALYNWTRVLYCDTSETEGPMSGPPVGLGEESFISFGMSCIPVELTASVSSGQSHWLHNGDVLCFL
jgi:hypothetical protein